MGIAVFEDGKDNVHRISLLEEEGMEFARWK